MRLSWTLPLLLGASVAAGCAGARGRADSAHAAASVAAPDLVRLRVGDGPVSAPVPNPAEAATRVVFAFPAEFADQRVDLTIERDGAKAPWMAMRPRLRTDATLPLAGVPAGCYRVRATLENSGVRYDARAQVTVAGEDELAVTMHLVTAGRAAAAPSK